MSKAKSTAKPRKDKANRPSPPDRDGDGQSGGSLAGNATAAAALGSDDAALAAQEIAADGLATIIIKGATTGKGNSHPVGVNGRIRHITTNVEVQVDAAELEALEASHIEFETVVPLAPADAAGVEGSSSAAEPAVEVEPEPAPVEGAPADEADETVTQPEGEPAA